MDFLLPKFFKFLKKLSLNIRTKNQSFQLFFLSSFIFLFLGFFFGSLIGTFLDIPRGFGLWDGLTILLIILFSELITLGFYLSSFSFLKKLNLLKIGFLLSIFIDAFKVGS